MERSGFDVHRARKLSPDILNLVEKPLSTQLGISHRDWLIV
jgi:hypothetical protein